MASSYRSTRRVLCERAARQRAGRRARRCPGASRRATLHRAARWSRRHTKIQQRIYQGERISRLANAWRPHAHQFTVAQSTTARHTETARECGGVHSAGPPDRIHHGGGGVLAVGQLLVAGARGHPGGRLTRGGGRVHARVAPAVCGGGAGARHGGLAVAGAAAAAARAAPNAAVRGAPPVPWRGRLPAPAVRTAAAARRLPALLTQLARALLSSARKD